MAGSVSTRIVTDGLVFYLDAANERSYSGAGATWSDISSKQIQTTISGPTFTKSNVGIFQFDGVSNNVTTTFNADNLEIDNCDNPFTFSIWFRTTGSGDYYFFDNTSGLNGITIKINSGFINVYLKGSNGLGSTLSTQIGSSVYNDGNWHNVSIIWKGGKSVLFYGNLFYDSFEFSEYTIPGKVPSVLGTFKTEDNFTIGSSNTPSNYFEGDMAIVMVYKRALVYKDIIQNYNALKKRFL